MARLKQLQVNPPGKCKTESESTPSQANSSVTHDLMEKYPGNFRSEIAGGRRTSDLHCETGESVDRIWKISLSLNGVQAEPVQWMQIPAMFCSMCLNMIGSPPPGIREPVLKKIRLWIINGRL
jgi:hypothetical protein